MTSLNLTPFRSEPVAGAVIEYCHPSDDFWRAWRESKDSLKAAGVSVTKDDNGHYVVKRYKIPVTSTPTTLANGYELKATAGLFPYQVAPAGQLVAVLLKHGAAIDASDPGTGKTYVFLAAARELDLAPAVFCPLSAMAAWKRAAAHMGVRILFMANYEAARGKNFRFGTLSVAKGSKYKSYVLKNFGDKVLLAYDEGHRCKGETTANCELLVAAGRQKVKTVIMTATLASNPSELKAAGFVLGLHSLYNFNEWRKNLGGFQNKFNAWQYTDALSAMQKLSGDIFPAHGVRVRIAELGDQFPETQITAESYPVDGVEVQNAEYEKLLQDLERLGALAASAPELKKKAAEALTAYEALGSAERAEALAEYQRRLKEARAAQAALLTQNLRYRQQSEALKVDLFVEMARDAVENGLSVAIFVNYEATLTALQKALKCPVVHGKQDAAERDGAVQAFQSDAERVIVLNIQAGGIALSLHDLNGNHARLALIAPTYNEKELKQVLGRVHRSGGRTKSLQRLVYAAGTVEEKVCRSVMEKLKNLDALNDGDLFDVPQWQLLAGEAKDE